MRHPKIRHILPAACIIMLGNLPATAQDSVECAADRVDIYKAGMVKAASISVEVADTPALREQGLMFRQDLPENSGMLFIYDQPQKVTFWMRNTLIGLDLLFIDQDGQIRHIHPQAIPLDETAIPGNTGSDPAPERLMVLEIGAGQAEALRIETGDHIAYPQVSENLFTIKCK